MKLSIFKYIICRWLEFIYIITLGVRIGENKECGQFDIGIRNIPTNVYKDDIFLVQITIRVILLSN